MSQSEQTPRERFVEAMNRVGRCYYGHDAAAREAVEAFADAECECIHDGCFDCAGHDDKHDYAFCCSHELCRTELLRACGLED